MVLTTDQVYAALVTSSIFLMAISLPKVMIYTAWSSWRLFTYQHLLGSPFIRMFISEEIIQTLIKPEKQLEIVVKEMESYTREMKKPLVELLAAFVLLPLSASGLQIGSDAGGLIVFLEALMVIAFLLAFVRFARMVIKLQRTRGGGPLI
jgi:hypothetical protein